LRLELDLRSRMDIAPRQMTFVEMKYRNQAANVTN